MTSEALNAARVVEEALPKTWCRIVDAAEEAFREIGYQKTTVADIAKTLRMSPANVYRFFDSKKAIHEAVLARLMATTETRVDAIARECERSAAQRIEDIVVALHDTCVQRCRANPRIHEMVEAAVTESWDVCRIHLQRIGGSFERVVAEGVAAGEFSVTDTKLAGACIHTAVVRYCHPGLVSQYPDPGAPPLEAMIAFILRSLRPAAGP